MKRKKFNSIQLSAELFQCLYKELESKFLSEEDLNIDDLTVFQLYGFGNYNNLAPNIKNYVYNKTGNIINGKYLYNKIREIKNGNKKVIHAKRDYLSILLKSIDYKNRSEFINNSSFVSPKLITIEQNKETTEIEIDTQYYIGYYMEENKFLIRSKFTIFEGKSAEWDILYKNDELIDTYSYSGNCVTNGPSALSFYFDKEGSNIKKECFINVFYGNIVQYKTILLGCYCGFDRNANPVVGKIIFERVSDSEEQEIKVKETEIHPNFYHYLFNQRLIVNGLVPWSINELEVSSNYSAILESLMGPYHGFYLSKNGLLTAITFIIKDTIGRASIKVSTSNFQGKLKSLNNDTLLSLEISNFENTTYCNFSIQVNPVEPNIYLGYILSSIGTNLYCGRVLLWRDNKDIKKLTTSQQIFTLSNNKIQDTFNLKIRDYLVNKLNLNQQPNSTSANSLPERFYGAYEMILKFEKSELKGVLNLNKFFQYESDDFSYSGTTSFINGNINLQIEHYNELPIAGMIIVFVGNISQAKIVDKPGVFSSLDERNQPINGTVKLSFKGA